MHIVRFAGAVVDYKIAQKKEWVVLNEDATYFALGGHLVLMSD